MEIRVGNNFKIQRKIFCYEIIFVFYGPFEEKILVFIKNHTNYYLHFHFMMLP